MAALIPALTRGRTRVDPSVIRHVLQLVQADYLPGPSFSSKLKGNVHESRRYHSSGGSGSSFTAILVSAVQPESE
jgi:hypothetical protein